MVSWRFSAAGACESNMARSVISSCSSSGRRPWLFSRVAIVDCSSPRCNWAGAMFKEMGTNATPALRHALMVCSVRCSTKLPMGTIKPVSSATGMN